MDKIQRKHVKNKFNLNEEKIKKLIIQRKTDLDFYVTFFYKSCEYVYRNYDTCIKNCSTCNSEKKIMVLNELITI